MAKKDKLDSDLPSILSDSAGKADEADTGEFPADGPRVDSQNTPDGPLKAENNPTGPDGSDKSSADPKGSGNVGKTRDDSPTLKKAAEDEGGAKISPSRYEVPLGGSGIGDRVPVERDDFHGSGVENTSVNLGKYREPATGDTIEVTEVTNHYVSFHYTSRGIGNQVPMALPISQFKMVGRFVPHEGQ